MMRRKTSQHLIPISKNNPCETTYDIYPSSPAEKGSIKIGYVTLAEEISTARSVILDGYVGVDWEEVRSSLDSGLRIMGLNPSFININDFLKPEEKISSLVEPFFGG